MPTVRLSPPRRRPLAALALATAAVAAAAGIACESPESYVFSARRFDEAGQCLEPYVPIEVVAGPGASARCALRCLSVGTETYVSALCPPLPTNATELPTDDEACKAALAVAEVTCGDGDSGPDTDAPDAGADATKDGTTEQPDTGTPGDDAGDGGV